MHPFAVNLTNTPLRSVIFVSSPASTESQSEQIAERVTNTVDLPHEDLSRLDIELGRESIIGLTGIKRVVPHHAGLTTLEQHLVEKWIREDIIKTVVATPTLAEGVNLPFDISLITSVYRFNKATKKPEDLPLNEIQNMIGRAGRAGHVSDGLCLITLPTKNGEEKAIDSARKYFFRKERIQDYLGLSNSL